MKAPVFFAAALLTLGLSTTAFAQTKPANTAPVTASPAPVQSQNDTNPMAPSNNQTQVLTSPSGANIANNRDMLSPGTGTQVAPATTPAERQARRDNKRAAKDKTK